ncbi:MAG: transposase [Armatimonadetes bacterium]|nr:transposase [Armatimonadota bacterium]
MEGNPKARVGASRAVAPTPSQPSAATRGAAAGLSPRSADPDPVHSAHRWVVERTHHWLHQWRHIFLRWHRKAANYLAALQLAAAVIAFRAAGVLG